MFMVSAAFTSVRQRSRGQPMRCDIRKHSEAVNTAWLRP